MTEYVILAKMEDGAWLPGEKTVMAHNREAAVREAFSEGHEGNPSGEWVAVPARSWKPLTVSVETETKLRFT